MSRVLLFVLFLLPATASGQSLLRPPGATTLKKGLEVEVDIRSFTTSETRDRDGESRVLPEGDAFGRLDTDVEIRYGVGVSLELQGGLRYRRNNTEHGGASYSSSGAESVWAGAKYAFGLSKSLDAALGGRYRSTLYDSDELDADQLLLGDSGQEFELGLNLDTKGRALAFSAYAGYRSPPDLLSDEIPWRVQVLLRGKRHAAELGVAGVFSLDANEYNGTGDRPVRNTGTTGLYNSLNRSWVKPYGGLYRRLGKRWRLGLNAAYVASGVSTDTGVELGLNLLAAFGGETKERRKIKKFKSYTIEATILNVSKRRIFASIDAGLIANVEKGMKFDIYQTDFEGGNLLVASAVGWKVGTKKAIIRIMKKYRDIPVKKGMTVRGR